MPNQIAKTKPDVLAKTNPIPIMMTIKVKTTDAYINEFILWDQWH